jgi:hypothetical protein
MTRKTESRPKTYRSPRLKEYGSIRKVTRTTGDKNPTQDALKGKFNKT